ncbi:hypothetical protein OG874_35665 [Nocardia sp. NBC_00565]|uniref:hypothetical protein n=1 Tax=Nocardia sp. NBC_00565 TaxID=2975993 RepID=UPI002E810661|nr:hypothetical protein [Nocardia sp. NBC_00565]WUC02029.1 hypothetical protein OG874_35665 [Nocardia sp. NBC_00565]
MAVQVVGRSHMTSDQTGHQAKSVGLGGWVVSFLPGRTLSIEQATAAMQAAEAVATVGLLADFVGLTTLELAGMATSECTWPPPPSDRRRGLWRVGGLR